MHLLIGITLVLVSWSSYIYAERTDEQLDKDIDHLQHSIDASFKRLDQMKHIRSQQNIFKPAGIDNIPLAFKQAWHQKDFLRYPDNPYNKFFRLAPPGKPWDFELHAWFQADADYLLNSYGLLINDGTVDFPATGQNTVMRYWVRRMRPNIQGQLYGFINYFVNVDFGVNNTSVYDAFVDLNYFRLLGLQIGQQMSLVSGIENFFENFNYLSRAYTMEVSSSSMLAPDRQVGLVAHGSFGPSGGEPYFTGLSMLGFDDMFSYQLGWLTDTPDNLSPTIKYDYLLQRYLNVVSWQSLAFEGRIFINPFIDRPGSILHHLGLGFAGSIGHPNNQGDLPALTSVGLNPIFNYRISLGLNDELQTVQVVANGPRYRFHPQMVWGYGPLGLLADWVQSSQVLALRGENELTAQYPIKQNNTAQQISFIYNLTQEEFNLFHFIPNRPFHLFEKGSIGGWQMVMRLAGLNLDPNVFDKSFSTTINENSYKIYYFADPRLSVQKASTWSIGLNWFWNQYLRISAEYNQTSFIGGCSTGGIDNQNGNTGCQSSNSIVYYDNPTDIYLESSQVLNRPTEKIFSARIQLQF